MDECVIMVSEIDDYFSIKQVEECYFYEDDEYEFIEGGDIEGDQQEEQEGVLDEDLIDGEGESECCDYDYQFFFNSNDGEEVDQIYGDLDSYESGDYTLDNVDAAVTGDTYELVLEDYKSVFCYVGERINEGVIEN
ncbi:MAG: hypothetical protein EZS28_051442 [Streblomastix strix]|uniref:Uncharacterized protein n=1 Tax=Streblomastix strix TaxID=222440 RepID=A0A5J4T5G9_9EUKA|nr:MAG: hypothetical protein EZS28_051442 [Streblomastix strix]